MPLFNRDGLVEALLGAGVRAVRPHRQVRGLLLHEDHDDRLAETWARRLWTTKDSTGGEAS